MAQEGQQYEDRPLVVDIHTHVYTPAYMEMLRSRTDIPLVKKAEDGSERVLLLKEEVEASNAGSSGKGRPVGPQYWDKEEKLNFMDDHGIDISVISLANPWLDFLSPSEAIAAATKLNADLSTYCSSPSPARETTFYPLTQNRLFAFGSLPIVPGVQVEKVLEELERIKGIRELKGVVMGTKGLGKGLDDEKLEPIWEALAEAGLMVFVHPHYGIGGGLGEADNGHVLPLALGFPFETTIAISRLILSGTLDRHPTLRLLLAHSAGALPALSSRLASCVAHDPTVRERLDHDFRYYLGLLWFDAVAYGAEELNFLEKAVSRASGYEGREEELAYVDRVIERKDKIAPSESFPGCDRIFFGTDHPFFPPLNGEARWKSVDENIDAILSVPGWGDEERRKVLGENAVEVFGLEL